MASITRNLTIFFVVIGLITGAAFFLLLSAEFDLSRKVGDRAAEQILMHLSQIFKREVEQLTRSATYYVDSNDLSKIALSASESVSNTQYLAKIAASKEHILLVTDANKKIMFRSQQVQLLNTMIPENQSIDISYQGNFAQITVRHQIIRNYSEVIGYLYLIKNIDLSLYTSMGLAVVKIVSNQDSKFDSLYKKVTNIDVNNAILIKLDNQSSGIQKLIEKQISYYFVFMLIILLLLTGLYILLRRKLSQPLDQLYKAIQDESSLAKLHLSGADPVVYEISKIFRHLSLDIAKKKANMRRLVQELKKDKEQLRKDNTLLQVLSHDIANPISVVKGTCEIAKSLPEGDSEERLRHLIDRVHRAIQTAEQITVHVRDMLAVRSGKKTMTLSMVDLDDVFADTRFVFEDRLLQKEITLSYANNSLNNLMVADRVSFTNNVFHNLISNAIKFSPRSSTIWVVADICDDWFHICIRDQGKGIDSTIISDIFLPDRKTSSLGTDGEKGTGFGLPVAKTYMDSFGGRITVDTVVEGASTGTTFHLYLRRSLSD